MGFQLVGCHDAHRRAQGTNNPRLIGLLWWVAWAAFFRKIGWRPAPWIHGSTPQLGIWHNQAQGKSTVDSWVGKFGWWKKYVTKCPMDLVGKLVNTIVPMGFFFGKKEQTKRRRRWMCKAPEFFENVLWLLCFPLKMGTSTECPFYRLGSFLQFFSDELKRSCFHLEFLRKHNVWKELAHQMFPKIGVRAPKSSFLVGCFIINHPFWGTPIFGNTHLLMH